ncbi:hypothetical protein K2173_009679 [Erythroxylum novogranatense]|uniref:Ribosomal protein S13 n=1 Tax=Erythroxylum novogranatense TaxID=1862640 RepID=A0AAV8U7D1_9ROSI|nr:hypothetical protein K2173_009679 [Erythroxylum novogranatense]
MDLNCSFGSAQLLVLSFSSVQCFRVGNTDIPHNKRIEVALQHIHGVGRRRAHQIISELGIGNRLTKDLTGVQLNSLREEVSKYLTGFMGTAVL